ncbi:MAG: glycosyltransferase family 39 protein, partial [Anaerolineae bacterium]|nr:glycosyltransferase family 39 protein [Anaerolineae bacterium]
MTQSKTRRVLLRPLSCCLLIFALLILTLDAQSIWWDEGISLHLAGLPWGEIIRDRAANIHPPLYFLILKAWMGLVGRTPFAGRALSALAMTLLPAAVTRFLTRRVGARAGRAAALLVALGPPFIIY